MSRISNHWDAARGLCVAAETLIAFDDATPPVAEPRYASAPRPARERASRLIAAIANAHRDLMTMPDSIGRTELSNALDRMSAPLDTSVRHGATAAADARLMQTIRTHILGVAPLR
jgi:hypothetical protein